ncbi:MAG TPA: class I SAM-dependent methyltransferase [Gemmatimonadaceae bacterium]|nr:class I SAM-dependent methyltransferase [Gemmatimonadaceae bacterium]
MQTALIVLNVILLAAVALLGWHLARVRRQRKQRGLFGPWPIRKVGIEEIDPVFGVDELGPTPDAEVRFIGRGSIAVPGGTSDAEAWILSVLAKRSRLAFEFGTCTGKTAYLWARNMPPEGRVVTLTLPPDQLSAYRRDDGDSALDVANALEESRFTRFRYSGTEEAGRITQLFGDSKTFDDAPYRDSCDLIFVDGSHAYSYVLSDSRKALRMVRPDGLVLWHDYDGARRHANGVFKALNELSREVPLVHIAGTTLVAYRRPAEGR